MYGIQEQLEAVPKMKPDSVTKLGFHQLVKSCKNSVCWKSERAHSYRPLSAAVWLLVSSYYHQIPIILVSASFSF